VSAGVYAILRRVMSSRAATQCLATSLPQCGCYGKSRHGCQRAGIAARAQCSASRQWRERSAASGKAGDTIKKPQMSDKKQAVDGDEAQLPCAVDDIIVDWCEDIRVQGNGASRSGSKEDSVQLLTKTRSRRCEDEEPEIAEPATTCRCRRSANSESSESNSRPVEADGTPTSAQVSIVRGRV
jgi:hypothetical protein